MAEVEGDGVRGQVASVVQVTAASLAVPLLVREAPVARLEMGLVVWGAA